jgi:hypothetical protein
MAIIASPHQLRSRAGFAEKEKMSRAETPGDRQKL